jgi:hypothetical protein
MEQPEEVVNVSINRFLVGDPTGSYGQMVQDDATVLIPVTLEPVTPVAAGGPFLFTKYLSPHFGVNVWMSNAIPGHTYIEIHWGNTVADTEDCILAGMRRGNDGVADGILQSKIAWDLFMKETENETELYVTYVDPPLPGALA